MTTKNDDTTKGVNNMTAKNNDTAKGVNNMTTKKEKTLSQKAIVSTFADAASARLNSADSFAQKAQTADSDEVKSISIAESVRLYRHHVRDEQLSNMNVKTIQFLQSIKVTPQALNTMLDQAMYAKDKIVNLLETCGRDSATSNAFANHFNLEVPFTLWKTKGLSAINSNQLQRELAHKGKTQAHYIERTLDALGIVRRTKIQSGIFEITINKESPIAQKLCAIYGISI